MIRHGEDPFLECSGDGFRPFSALTARGPGGASIEHIYQTSKIIDGRYVRNIAQGKGKLADNQEECAKLYSTLWDRYIEENPALGRLLMRQSGLSDKYGQRGHVCQATELWRIRERLLRDQNIPVESA